MLYIFKTAINLLSGRVTKMVDNNQSVAIEKLGLGTRFLNSSLEATGLSAKLLFVFMVYTF